MHLSPLADSTFDADSSEALPSPEDWAVSDLPEPDAEEPESSLPQADSDAARIRPSPSGTTAFRKRDAISYTSRNCQRK